MNLLIFVLEIVVLVFSTSVAEHEIIKRIMNGQDATWSQAKYTVLLIPSRSSEKGVEEFLCGGSLIGPNWVLTAAHCVFRILHVTVALGTLDAYDSQVVYELENTHIHLHPLYDSTYKKNDIALIQIPKTRECVFVGYARMPFQWIDRPLTHMRVTALGWGHMANDDATSTTLQSTPLTIISNEVCNATFQDVTDDDLCATSRRYGYTCHGDSGGPLVLDGRTELVGVIAATLVGSCEATKPVLAARVTSYLPWITDLTGITS